MPPSQRPTELKIPDESRRQYDLTLVRARIEQRQWVLTAAMAILKTKAQIGIWSGVVFTRKTDRRDQSAHASAWENSIS